MATFDSTKNWLPRILEAITDGRIKSPGFKIGFVADDDFEESEGS